MGCQCTLLRWYCQPGYKGTLVEFIFCSFLSWKKFYLYVDYNQLCSLVSQTSIQRKLCGDSYLHQLDLSIYILLSLNRYLSIIFDVVFQIANSFFFSLVHITSEASYSLTAHQLQQLCLNIFYASIQPSTHHFCCQPYLPSSFVCAGLVNKLRCEIKRGNRNKLKITVNTKVSIHARTK